MDSNTFAENLKKKYPEYQSIDNATLVRKVVEKHYKSSKLFVIEKCGHVVNVEQSTIFNKEVIAFIQNS